MKKLSLIILVLVLASLCTIAIYAELKSPPNFMAVEIFRGDPPGKPYKVLGEIDQAVPAGMSRAQAISLLKQKAFDEYKADAVINVLVSEKRTGGTPRTTGCPEGKAPCETREPTTTSETHATGTAIKWK